MEDKEFEDKKNEVKIAKNSIFSKENVNIGHQPEFDYLKTLFILIMLPNHVSEHYCKDCFTIIVDYVGFMIGAAGIMMLMGIGMRYSRHQEPSYYFSAELYY
jgi:hypothetical protein